MSQVFSPSDVKKISLLAKIPLSEDELETLANGFSETMKVVDTLNSVDVGMVEPTHHTTGLTNIFREDIVDESRMFSQEQALKNGKRTHNGYFVVDQIIDQDEE